MPQLTLRKSQREDLSTITLFSDRYSKVELSKLLENPKVDLFVLQCGEEILGYAVVWKVLDEGELHWFEIFEPFRGRGLSYLFLESIIENLKKEGIKKLLLEVSDRNTTAKRVYKKIGFKPIGLRKNYYPDGSNAILMELNFNPYDGTKGKTPKGG